MSVEIEYKDGRRKRVSASEAKALVALKLATRVESSPMTYQTRALQAESPHAERIEAPYGYKKDGTPRARPGRSKAE